MTKIATFEYGNSFYHHTIVYYGHVNKTTTEK